MAGIAARPRKSQIPFSGVTGSPSAFAGFSLNIISSSRLLKPCERITSKPGQGI